MKIDTRLTEDDLRATILAVLRRAVNQPGDTEPVRMSVLLRDLTKNVMRAIETGEAQQ
jgi:hypothetical protein